jgi:hypothetical protein
MVDKKSFKRAAHRHQVVGIAVCVFCLDPPLFLPASRENRC